MHKRFFYYLFLLFFLPMLMMASTKGRIKGKVTDLQTGEPLIGANVIVEGTSIGAATDANGEFLLLNLEAGIYTVRTSYLGYQTVTISNIRVNADLTTEQDFQLPSEDITVGTVEIVATRPLIQKDNTNKVRITTSEDIENLPVRGVNSIIGLTAGVVITNGNLHIRGGRQDEVGYYLEGVTITNPLTGGRAVTLSQDAVEEIQVQAGGYTAEFGGANAGIIRQSLKSGGNNFRASFEYITDNVTFQGRDDAYTGDKRLGAYWWGYNEMSAVLSGPVFDQRFKFFVNFNYQFNRDPNQQNFPGANFGPIADPINQDTVNLVYASGPRPKNTQDIYNYIGTFNVDLKPLLFRLTATYASNRFDAGAFGIQNILNNRVGQTDQTNGAFSLKMTHVLSPNMYYELSGGLFLMTSETYDRALQDNYWAYGDSVANAEAGYVWERREKDIDNGQYGRYITPVVRNLYGFAFTAPDRPSVNYSKFDRNSINFAGSLSLLLGKTHSIKLGGEYQSYNIRSWAVGGQTTFAAKLQNFRAAYPNETEDQIKERVLINEGISNYGYDVLGNELDDDGLLGPKKPVFASAYIQDRIEYEDLILNVGLRYDYFDIDNWIFSDQTRPDLAFDPTSSALKPEGWVKAPTFSALSPRIGFSFPVTDRTVFHAQYGKFVQQPSLNNSYNGAYRRAFEIKGGFFIPNPVGLNVRPTRTTQYEVGFTQQIADFMSFDITGYYRDVKDQVVFQLQDVDRNSPFQSYYILGNGDFATTKGIELTFNMRRFERVAVNATLAFQDARGTGSFPNSNRGIVGAPLDGVTQFAPQYVSPLEFNNSLRANGNIDYRFGDNDGPSLLHNFGVSVLFTYNSGHPFTRGIGAANIGLSQPGSGDARFRIAAEPLNASTTPSNFQIDLRVDKTFTIYDRLKSNIYIYVINLFDTKNPTNVYLKTGSADDDGYISDPTESATLINTYGEQYVDLYRALVIDNAGLYGPSRQIRLGIRLEY